MTLSSDELTRSVDLQPLLDKVVAAGAPGIITRVQTPTKTLELVSGAADRKTGAPMTPEMHFRIGSSTKTFVATVILQLAGEGNLSLDDPVARWLPWLPQLRPGSETITVRQLLNHTSGLFNFLADPVYWLMALTGKEFDPRELVLIATLRPLNFAPGTNWKYSNTNYILAGMIIEKITGHRLGDELHTRIFQHLELDNTTFPTGREMPSPHARGYAFIEGAGYFDITTTIHPSAYWAAGAIISTAADLGTFYHALLGGSLLPPELLKEMKTTAIGADGKDTGCGLGLARLTHDCGTMWGHGGEVPGYFSPMTSSSPDGTRSVVSMINIAPHEWLSSVEEPFNHANVAVLCYALLERAPATCLGEAAGLGRLVPYFDDWSGITEIIKQTRGATLDLNLLDSMSSENS